MKRRAIRRRTRATVVAGFTLVELLTVIAIIVLLIGILVPAISKVRESARKTATATMIGTVSTALETYRADRQLGGDYPASASDLIEGSALSYEVWSPYSSLPSGPMRQIEISGAGLLVWALAGADLLGCPGFKTFRDRSNYWGQDTDDRENGLGDSGAYALNDDREPVHPRVSPFVDLTKVAVTKWNPNATTSEGLGSFELSAEVEASQTLGLEPERRLYPMFVDDFGGPLLYWRADPAGLVIADRSPTDGQALGANRGTYHFADNQDLLDVNENPLRLTAADMEHRLFFDYPAPINPINEPDLNIRAQNFPAYIHNQSIAAKVAPQRADSYMLISAGPDGIFGTADDIANFDHNGAALLAP